MQQLDLVRPAGMVVATSNLPEDLDSALLRRFDLASEFPAPERDVLMDYARRTAAQRGVDIVNGVEHALAAATTYAEAEKILVAEHRRIIVQGG